ncbi:MAG: hypothetical protein ACKO3P_16565, partial [Planctomycetaceae bacterium]
MLAADQKAQDRGLSLDQKVFPLQERPGRIEVGLDRFRPNELVDFLNKRIDLSEMESLEAGSRNGFQLLSAFGVLPKPF